MREKCIILKTRLANPQFLLYNSLMKNKFSVFKFIVLFPLLFAAAMPVFSQAIAGGANSQTAASGGAELPLQKLTVFSSGLGLFVHKGNVSSAADSPAQVRLSFTMNAVNDALKSMVVNDPRSDFPTVSYASASALYETLRSLKIDLSGNPGMGEILGNLRGAEIEVSAPNPIAGRIVGVEYRMGSVGENVSMEPWLSIYTQGGIKTIALKDISAFTFKDPAINADLARALDLILGSRDSNSRELLLSLPGEGSRDVSLSYVIPVPVWKVSYRLNLGGASGSAGSKNGNSFFQGWAIVDNDSDTDWNNVELSLVSGRPVSFVQNLYTPYHTYRPVMPLGIAGIAESRTYESGSSMADKMAMESPVPSPALRARAPGLAYEEAEMDDSRDYTGSNFAGSGVYSTGYQTAAASQAGDQFAFTLKNPVSIERRKSAMLPLVETSISAEKKLVFSGAKASPGVSMNPAICAELTNTSGMSLPAGSITVYDGGTYAGDALVEFLPENEKRLISFGDDLSVSGSVSNTSLRLISTVSISKGVMTISRKQNYERTYTIKNASAEEKKIIIEHPINQSAALSQPAAPDESTPSLYRFNQVLPANKELVFVVKEEAPLSERVVLAQLRQETFLSYTTNQEIPANVRAALQKAIELRQKTEEATLAKRELENQQVRLIADQDRIRRNLEVAGNQTPQGQDYLKRMSAMDGEIDALNASISEAETKVQAAKKEYDDYLAALSL